MRPIRNKAPMAPAGQEDPERRAISPKAASVNGLTTKPSQLRGAQYIETQIHGGVKLSDIKEVWIKSGSPLKSKLKSAGVSFKEY